MAVCCFSSRKRKLGAVRKWSGVRCSRCWPVLKCGAEDDEAGVDHAHFEDRIMNQADSRQWWRQQLSPIKQQYVQQFAQGNTAVDIGTGAGFYGRMLQEKG